MNTTQAEYCRVLIRHLRAMPAERFNIGQYKYDNGCDTVRCVAGEAGEIREFQEAGLLSLRSYAASPWFDFEYCFYSEYVGKFLGLNGNESLGEIAELFYQSGYKCIEKDVTAAMAADKLERMLQDHGHPAQIGTAAAP